MAYAPAKQIPAPPEKPRPAPPALRPENRAWGSPRFSNKTRPAHRPRAKQPRRANRPCPPGTASGVSYERYRYSPFGQIEIYSPTGTYLGNSTKNSAIGNTRTWNTRILDPDTNLYMYKYRHYHAGLGRFMSRDPIGEAEAQTSTPSLITIP